jgi:uncharacterized phage-like protein YoqJ
MVMQEPIIDIGIDNPIKSTCTIKGHRPPKLGGYDKDNPTALKVQRLLYDEIIRHIEEYKVTRFICGGALGVDQIALDLLYELKKTKYSFLHIILALPFKDFTDRCWHKANYVDTTKINEAKVDEVIYVNTLADYKIDEDNVPAGKLLNEQLAKRDQYRIDNSFYMLAVWDGSNGGTGGSIDYFNNKAPEGRKLTIINHVEDTIQVSYN